MSPCTWGQQTCGELSPEGIAGLLGGQDRTHRFSEDEARGFERSWRRDVDFCYTLGLQRNSSFQSGLSARHELGCVLGLLQGGGGHLWLPGTTGDFETPAASRWAGFSLEPEGLFGVFFITKSGTIQS